MTNQISIYFELKLKIESGIPSQLFDNALNFKTLRKDKNTILKYAYRFNYYIHLIEMHIAFVDIDN